MAPAFRAARMSAMVISSGTSNDSIRTFSLRFSLVEYSTRSLASLSKRGSCIESYDSIDLTRCNRCVRGYFCLTGSNELGCEGAVHVVSKRKRLLLLLQMQHRQR